MSIFMDNFLILTFSKGRKLKIKCIFTQTKKEVLPLGEDLGGDNEKNKTNMGI